MGRKKQITTSSLQPCLQPSRARAAETPEPTAIRQKYERALDTLRLGNHAKALRIMNESASKFENSGLYHRAAGKIFIEVAGLTLDPADKKLYLKNAVDSARRAATLSPNSMEFSHFYANLLFELADVVKDFDKVVDECERALGLENPIDPAKESLDETVSLSKEARIGELQTELKKLIQKANISSISMWMKNISNEDGRDCKYRLIPLRQMAEHRVEERSLFGNETPEQIRRGIEMRLATTRLLQEQEANKAVLAGGSQSSSPVSGSGTQPRSPATRSRTIPMPPSEVHRNGP